MGASQPEGQAQLWHAQTEEADKGSINSPMHSQEFLQAVLSKKFLIKHFGVCDNIWASCDWRKTKKSQFEFFFLLLFLLWASGYHQAAAPSQTDNNTNTRLVLALTDLCDDHFLVWSIDADEPLAQVEEHGAHHPLPGLRGGKKRLNQANC